MFNLSILAGAISDTFLDSTSDFHQLETLNQQPSMSTTLTLAVPAPYDFVGSLRGHGWLVLEPYRALENGVERMHQVQSGRIIRLVITATQHEDHTAVHAATPTVLDTHEQKEVRRVLQTVLRLNDDFSSFYAQCKATGGSYEDAIGKGRLLCSPTVFEDAVKVVLTTNTTWKQTQGMTRRIVEGLGPAWPGDATRHAFPCPQAFLDAGEAYFKKVARVGYRAPALVGLAERAAELEAFRTSTLDTPELRKQLLSFRGIGPYAAATLLMLLGRYDYLAIDSEVRAFTAKKYFNGRIGKDAEIRALYADWGRWTYLGYVLDWAPLDG